MTRYIPVALLLSAIGLYAFGHMTESGAVGLVGLLLESRFWAHIMRRRTPPPVCTPTTRR